MTTSLKNTTISGTGYIAPPAGTTTQRPTIYTTTIQWTNTGSQSYSVLAGPTPTLTSTSWTAPTGVTQVEVLVVAGGGGGGQDGNGAGGGGGAGGLIYNPSFTVTPGNSYTVTVGAGGAGAPASGVGYGTQGSNSVFGSLTAIGGGFGSARQNSGSGGSSGGTGDGTNGSQWTPGSPTANQGFSGGFGPLVLGAAGGGGGAGGPGGNGSGSSGSVANGGGGGPGLNFSISGTPTWYAGGGGGATYVSGTGSIGAGGIGGGGNGGKQGTPPTTGTASTGGGGGGSGSNAASYSGGAGGSGIVIIRYSVQSDNTDPRGLMRYNTEVKGYEMFEGGNRGWVSQDTTRNFGGHNLHTYSEQLDNTYWTGSGSGITVSANAAGAPDRTLTADSVIPSNANTAHYLYSGNYTKTASAPQTTSLYAKRVNYDYITIQGSDNTSGSTVQQGFNLATGAIGTTTISGSGVFVSASMIDVGNGWYRCILVASSPGTTGRTAIGVGGNGTLTNAGDGSSYNLIWGVQVEDNIKSAGPYTRTVDANSPIPTALNGYRIHSYTSVGTSSFSPAVSGYVEVLVVAGGGSGGANNSGGGGAGGLIYNSGYHVTSGQTYTVTVGAGGQSFAGGSGGSGYNGSNSIFGGLIAIGGGGGSGGNTGVGNSGTAQAYNGGSGGGQCRSISTVGQGIFGQGNAGGTNRVSSEGGGGGGAGGGGGSPNGGSGLPYSLAGGIVYYAGGGGGGAELAGQTAGIGGAGGGGNGGNAGSATAPQSNYWSSGSGQDGKANTGGGGGGESQGNASYVSGAGGSGIVIVRYRYD